MSKYYTFPGYDEEDVKQEACLIGLSILPKYNEERGSLENFLYFSISNRLRNLIKAKYFDYDRAIEGSVNEAKQKINRPASSEELIHYYFENFKKVDSNEIIEKIDTYLRPDYRRDFKRILEGHSVKTTRRTRIIEEVKRIYFLIYNDREDVLKSENR